MAVAAFEGVNETFSHWFAAGWCHAGGLRRTGSDVAGGGQFTETAQSPSLGPGRHPARFVCGFSPTISLKSASTPYYPTDCMKGCS